MAPLTKRQKAACIDGVFAAMQELLGRPDEASYCVIREVPADGWGYGGKTQEYRFITTRN